MKFTNCLKTAVLLLALSLNCATRAEIVQNTKEHFDLEVVIDCDGDGIPEDVLELSGDLHIVITETNTKGGDVISTTHYQPVNVSAVGVLTGDTYRAVGVTRSTDVVRGDNEAFTFVNNFYMIGQKSGIKSLFQQVFHATVVNGELIVFVDHVEVRCP